ncbi:MAG: hypothetical protein WC683_07665 [bacterium]|jgi:hypothetical protein
MSKISVKAVDLGTGGACICLANAQWPVQYLSTSEAWFLMARLDKALSDARQLKPSASTDPLLSTEIFLRQNPDPIEPVKMAWRAEDEKAHVTEAECDMAASMENIYIKLNEVIRVVNVITDAAGRRPGMMDAMDISREGT